MLVHRVVYKISFIVALVAILILSVTPHPKSHETQYSTMQKELSVLGEVAYVGEEEIGRFSDKYRHLVAFWVLALLFDLGYTLRVLFKFFFLISYGMLIEIVQYFVPYRDFDLYDILFNTIFIVLYYIFRKLFFYRFLDTRT